MEGSNWMFYFWCSTSTLFLQRALTRNNELKFNLLKCAITPLVRNTLKLKFQTRVPGQKKTFAPFEMEIDLKLMVPFSDLKPIPESTSAKARAAGYQSDNAAVSFRRESFWWEIDTNNLRAEKCTQ